MRKMGARNNVYLSWGEGVYIVYTMPFYEDRLSKNSTKINILRNRVAIAIELIEEGSIACGQMITTLFFPPLPFIFQVCQFLMVIT